VDSVKFCLTPGTALLAERESQSTIAIAVDPLSPVFRRKVVVKSRAAQCRSAAHEARRDQGQRQQRRCAAGSVTAAGAGGVGYIA
jgi:hypothetical protein